MSWISNTFGSTVGKKVIVGLSGIALVLFAIMHLAGNLLLYVGPDAYNAYADKLHHLPILPVVEIGLAGVFVLHIVMTISLAVANRQARGSQKYAVTNTKQSGVRAFASRYMVLTGGIFFIFLVTHVAQMKFGLYVEADESLRPYDHTILVLSNPWIATLYAVGSILLGFHLAHGIQSTMRSLGIYHSEFTPFLERWGVRLAFLLAIGFASFPVWVRLTFM